MVSNLFISTAYAATPGVGNSGLDLIIILVCLSLLTGIIYLMKFIIERFRHPQSKSILPNNNTDSIEKGEA